MASSSKRKRPANPHAAHFEIISLANIVQPTATSRTVTFDQHAGGRLGQQKEIVQVEISAEDLAVLIQDLEFSSLPDDDTLNLEYFEHSVQQGDDSQSMTYDPHSSYSYLVDALEDYTVHYWGKHACRNSKQSKNCSTTLYATVFLYNDMSRNALVQYMQDIYMYEMPVSQDCILLQSLA